MKIFCLLFFLLPLQVVSQIKITGTVTETVGNHPVLYATVYVNGTSNGTITNTSGQFSLDNVFPPCEIVVSHISYSTEVIALTQNTDTVLQVKLNPKDVELEAVEVIDKNLREENLSQFKKHFLGADYWGKRAKIENDSVLVFHREKVSVSEGGSLESGLLAVDTSSSLFVVNTKGPLLVYLPLLGYRLHINLIHYTELETGSDTNYEFHTLGYFYFQPEENTLKRKTNKFEKKRLKAYYNSDRHFCRSLFNDQLKENGYVVISYSLLNPESELYKFDDFEIDKYIIKTSDEAKIIGLKDRNFYVEYTESFNHPVNLKKREESSSSSSNVYSRVFSKMYLLQDTCIIRADGSRPGYSVMFGPEIGNKRVGAMLPYDFQPENVK